MTSNPTYRDRFYIPKEKGEELIYFCGNSLGLQPKSVGKQINEELSIWANQGVEGHFKNEFPWVSYHQQFASLLAPLVGAKESEVVAMNSLTTNLHLLLTSFYRPSRKRFKILCEKEVFPSDYFVFQSQAKNHGFSADDALIEVNSESDKHILEEEVIIESIKKHHEELACVVLGGVNYVTGQLLDMRSIAKVCQEYEIPFGVDLAHAIGNVELKLNEWGIDFAVWCSYKYLNGGPGAVGGVFVHEKHHKAEIPRLQGWWGTKEEGRFLMKKEFISSETVNSWQLSNAPILSMAALKPSLLLFEEAGMDYLLKQKEILSTYLIKKLIDVPGVEIITPLENKRRGCQVSILVSDKSKEKNEALRFRGVISDWRSYQKKGIIRVAPVPLYNTIEEIDRFVDIFVEE